MWNEHIFGILVLNKCPLIKFESLCYKLLTTYLKSECIKLMFHRLHHALSLALPLGFKYQFNLFSTPYIWLSLQYYTDTCKKFKYMNMLV